MAKKVSSLTSYTGQLNMTNEGSKSKSGIAEKQMHDSLATPVVRSGKEVGIENGGGDDDE